MEVIHQRSTEITSECEIIKKSAGGRLQRLAGMLEEAKKKANRMNGMNKKNCFFYFSARAAD
jgi:hypothetical protein